jgi:ABC-2 type transport system permease protein
VNGGTVRRAGLLWLLRPKFRTKLNRARTDQGRIFKGLMLGFVLFFFWSLIFAVIFRMLIYFRGTQGIGDLLAAKLLGMALLTFLMILVLSNVITALSTFFLSEDLELVVAAPVEPESVYGARLAETIVDSSWMVLLLAIPLLVAYGVVYTADVRYYALAAATMVAFIVIPAVVGSALTLVLVNVFPARRTRDLLALVGLFAAAGVVALFRFIRPERLMRPEEFQSLVDFVAVLETPTSAWFPSEWAGDALMSYLNGSFQWFPFAFLWSTAAMCVVVGAWLHRHYYETGFTRAQEGAQRKGSKARSALLDKVFARAKPSTRGIIAKEVRVFFRDTTQWSQLILLAVLVAVYVYNITVLPLYTGEQLSFLLINVVSFLNLGLAGFVVAAIAARFVFPAMSIEGRMMWLLRSSPLELSRLFWSKYWTGTVPLLVVSLPLIVVTNVVLDASPFILILTTLTMIGITFAITSLALGFGALYPNYETENVAEIPTSFGGLLFMMAAVTYLAGVVILEAWPVYLYLGSRMAGGEAEIGAVPLVLGVSGALLLTLAAVFLPLRAGIAKVKSVDF